MKNTTDNIIKLLERKIEQNSFLMTGDTISKSLREDLLCENVVYEEVITMIKDQEYFNTIWECVYEKRR